MDGRALRTAVLVLLLFAGCGAREDAGKHTWPITQEQLDRLKKMSRVDRDAWLAGLVVPEYEARKLDGRITIDGVLDETDWARAGVVMLRDCKLGNKVRYGTDVRMLWDDEAVYLAFECEDPDVHNPLTKHDEDLWQHDVAEIFIDANGDSRSYMELHVAPSGATVDALWVDPRPQTDWFTSPHWERFDLKKGYEVYTATGMTSAVRVEGTLNQPDDTDRGYTVECRIPYAAMVKVSSAEQKPTGMIDFALVKQFPIERPTAGIVWRMNFCRSDDSIKVTTTNEKGKSVSVGEYSAWAPTAGSFHMPFLFGYVKFVE